MNKILVFNSSPLIILAKLDLLEEVIKYFECIYVPLEIVKEISQKQDLVTNMVQSLVSSGKIKVLKPEKLFIFSTRIHKGELETINLAKQLNAMAVLDDLVARKLARIEGVPLIGTLGIIKFLKALKLIRIDNKELFDKLKRAGFRMTKRLFFEIMKD